MRGRVENLGMRLVDKPCDIQELLCPVRELVGSPRERCASESHPDEGGSRVG